MILLLAISSLAHTSLSHFPVCPLFLSQPQRKTVLWMLALLKSFKLGHSFDSMNEPLLLGAQQYLFGAFSV